MDEYDKERKLKVYLMHKKGIPDRLTNVLDLLYACKVVDCIEIVTSESSDVVFADEAERSLLLPYDFPNKKLSLQEKSIFHKQYKAFQKISQDEVPSIILEDDVIFDSARFDRFVEEIDSLSSDWDFVFFGTGCNLSISGSGFVQNNNRLKSKCTDSMVVHPSAAKKIIEDMNTYKALSPIDWDLNYRFIKMNMKVYWYEPGITIQGSQRGIYKSEIQ